MATAPTSFTISCENCTMRATPACQDCVVTFICEREPGAPVNIDLAEQRAVCLLADAGLAPRLRHRRASL